VLGSAFVIERELGGGGMSRVFVGLETALGRRVVIKVLPPELAAGISLDRFRREIQVAAQLQHPHIVPVLSTGEADGLLYYAMPFVQGESLGARLARGALPVETGSRILHDIVRAIAYAHRHGVVHRDIKPDNVLLSEDGALVTDFGIAKALSAAAIPGGTLTGVGMALGTPAYMAPEQGVGDPLSDHRADIYSVGALAYEMFCGEQVFANRTPQQMMMAHAVQPAEPLTTRCPHLPKALAQVIMRCLEKDPAKRPQTAEDLLQQLDAATLPGGRRSGVRRTFERVAVAMGVAFLLLTGGAVAFAPRDRLATAIAIMKRKPATLHTNRIIVAPFENQTGDPKLTPLGFMAADWISQGLTRTGTLEVVDARTVAVTSEVVGQIPWPLRGRDKGRALAEETGAGLLLTGRFYLDGDSLRFNATISDVVAGKLLQSLTPVSGLASSPSAVIEKLRQRVVASLVQASDTVVLATLGSYSDPPNLDAYTELRKGIEAYFTGSDATLFSHLRSAISLDTTYVTPWVFLAFSAAYRDQPELADSALKHAYAMGDRLMPAERAMLDHVQAELRGDGEASLRAAQSFMELTPGSMESPLLATSAALSSRRPRLALEILRGVDPDRGLNLAGPFYWIYQGAGAYQLGDYKKSLEMSRAGLKRFPGSFSLSFVLIGGAAHLGRMDDIDDAIEAQSGANVDVRRARLALRAATILQDVGRGADAKRYLDNALRELASSGDTAVGRTMLRGNMLMALGRWAEAKPFFSGASGSSNPEQRVPALGALGMIAARTGAVADARRADSTLAALHIPYDRGFVPINRAHIAAQLAEPDKAFALVREAVAEGWGLQTAGNILVEDPWLRPIRGDRRFVQIAGARD